MAIIIVDDSVTNLVILKHLARGEQLPVEVFTAPHAASLYLASNDADLVIVDCEMPDFNGIDFIAAVRGFARHALTPIVMVTQHAATDIRRRAFEAGVSDFLSKPIDTQEFKTRIKSLLRLSSRGEMRHSA